MRFIEMPESLPDSEEFNKWQSDATRITLELDLAASLEERKAIIEANKDLWGKLKEWLLGLSNSKCWYSEVADVFQYYDVEHFRPKNSPKGKPEEGGYWWLAFDWQNYRICGTVGNTKKGAYFPLAEESTKCSRQHDIRFETPLLLDPADAHDASLIFFNSEGAIVPHPSCTLLEKERVSISYKRYGLDFDILEKRRKLHWAECNRLATIYLSELGKYADDKSNVIAKQGFIEAAKSIKKMLLPDRPLTSVVRAYIIHSGDPRLQKLLS